MQEILVIRFSALGDLVTLEPVLRACRNLFADARITFLTTGLGKELYESYFDRVVVTSVPKGKRFRQARAVARDLRIAHPYDLVIDLQCGTFSHLVTFFTARHRNVYRATPPLKRLLGQKSPGLTPEQLFVQCGLDQEAVAAYFGEPQQSEIRLQIPEQILDGVRHLLPDGRPIVALAPGASPQWPTKQWGVTRFAELAKALSEKDIRLLIVGSENERGLAQAILEQCPDAVDLTGKTRIRDLTALLAQVDALVGNDSGPAHLAAAAGAPTLSIFGPTDPRHSVEAHGYPGHHRTFAPSHTHCAPCYKNACPFNMECMAETPVSSVLAATLEILDRHHPDASHESGVQGGTVI